MSDRILPRLIILFLPYSVEYLRNETFRRENNITEEFLDEYLRMDHVRTGPKKIKSRYINICPKKIGPIHDAINTKAIKTEVVTEISSSIS